MAENFRKDGLVVLALNSRNEPRESYAAFIAENKLKHRFLLDGRAIREQYGIKGNPTVLWIDSRGKVMFRELGFNASHVDQLVQHTESLIKASR